MPHVDEFVRPEVLPAAVSAPRDWRSGLPTLSSRSVRIRELRMSDAPSLVAGLATEEVGRFMSPAPATPDRFERFIAWTRRERAAGRHACFAVTRHDSDTAIGIFQVRDIHVEVGTAEWGFAIASRHWGTGVFAEAAGLVLQFVFDTLEVRRLEARAAVINGRGTGALRKVGALQETVIPRSLARDGELLDQSLWTIHEDDWRLRQDLAGAQIH